MSHERMPRSAALKREYGYRFRVHFEGDDMPDLVTDEPPPLGQGSAPSPVMLLETAIANCLASSLTFCMQKARLPLEGMEAEVEAKVDRNEDKRLRVEAVRVRLVPRVTEETRAHMARCAEVFESFCVVTESVRRGVPVEVHLEPRVVADSRDVGPAALIGEIVP